MVLSGEGRVLPCSWCSCGAIQCWELFHDEAFRPFEHQQVTAVDSQAKLGLDRGAGERNEVLPANVVDTASTELPHAQAAAQRDHRTPEPYPAEGHNEGPLRPQVDGYIQVTCVLVHILVVGSPGCPSNQ